MAEQDDDDSQPTLDTVDAGSAEGVAAQQREKRRRQKITDEVWFAFLSSEPGRAQLWHMLTVEFGIWETRYGVFPNGSDNPQQSAAYAGLRDFGLRVYRSLLLIDGERVLRMHRENDKEFQRTK